MGWLAPLPPASDTGAVSYADVVPGAQIAAPFAADARIDVPDQRRPLSPGDLRHHLAGVPFTAVDGAGDESLAFVEWQRGDLSGIDRLELAEGCIVALRRYFDTLGLLAAHDPSVTALRAQLLSNAAS